MSSTEERDGPHGHFSVIVTLADDFSSVRTDVELAREVVRTYVRARPDSLLTDAVRWVASGEAQSIELRFRETRVTWRPGAYQVTLDAFRLVDVVARAVASEAPSSVLDVGCGSGVVGVALVGELRGAVMRADFLDVDEASLALCHENTREITTSVSTRLFSGDFGAWHSGMVYDLVVSNPPYFPSGSIRPDRGRVTMSDELGLYPSLVNAVGVVTNRVILTRSEAFADEVDNIIAARPDVVQRKLAAWRVPIPANLVEEAFRHRFSSRAGSAYELEHEVTVLELRPRVILGRSGSVAAT
jgi:predicted RNA methylase